MVGMKAAILACALALLLSGAMAVRQQQIALDLPRPSNRFRPSPNLAAAK